MKMIDQTGTIGAINVRFRELIPWRNAIQTRPACCRQSLRNGIRFVASLGGDTRGKVDLGRFEEVYEREDETGRQLARCHVAR